nr:halloween gene shadow [Cyrtorhinus lividipennis]
MLQTNLLKTASSRVCLSTVTAVKKTREIPYNGGLPIIGTGWDIHKAGGATKFHEYVDASHKQLGPIFKENMGQFKAVFISDPTLMRHIFSIEGEYPKHFVPKGWTLYNEIHKLQRGLFFMEGEEWYKHRKLMNKSFLAPDIVTNLKGVHQRLTNNLIQRLKKHDGQEVPDIAFEFYRHSISFVLGSLIGEAYWDKYDLYLSMVDDIARRWVHMFELTSRLEGLPSVKLVQLLNLSLWTQFEASVTGSLETSREVVTEALKHRSPNSLLDKLVKDGLSEKVIYAIVSDLLLAAGDTTSYTSQWASYFLGKHKEAQEAARKDPSLVKGVIKETLRLCPPAIFISRIIPEETSIHGYHLNKGEMVLLSLYSTGRNEHIYSSANQFQPDRWTKIPGSVGYKGVNETGGYLPFAMGVRSCIGVRLANAQLHYTVSEILKNFELTTVEDVEMILKLIPVPSKPLKIKIKCL